MRSAIAYYFFLIVLAPLALASPSAAFFVVVDSEGKVVADRESLSVEYSPTGLALSALPAAAYLAAVDSIITLYDPMGDRGGLGAVVLEWEAWRVIGYDVRSDISKFARDRGLYLRLVEDVATGIKRLREKGFSEVYAVLWVAAY